MVRNLLFLAAFVCVAGFSLEAQQLPLFTQYQDNLTLINPAAVNPNYLTFEQNVSFSGSHRSQWTGYEGRNPRTTIISGDYTSTRGRGFNMNVGGSLFTDKTGPTSFSGIYGRFSGIISNDPYYGGIAIGLTAGLVNYGFDGSEAILRDEGDVIGTNSYSQWSPDVGAGIFAYSRLDNYGAFDDTYIYGGVSIPQVLGFDLSFTDDNGDFNIKRIRHIYGTLGLIKHFRSGSYLQPSVWVKYVKNTPVSVDINLRYQLPSNFYVGAGASISGNLHLEAGFILGEIGYDNLLRIGYSYDSSFQNYGPEVGGSHEINIIYSFEN